eukprot:69497-Chlamydomonas_euryale.AAC.1
MPSMHSAAHAEHAEDAIHAQRRTCTACRGYHPCAVPHMQGMQRMPSMRSAAHAEQRLLPSTHPLPVWHCPRLKLLPNWEHAFHSRKNAGVAGAGSEDRRRRHSGSDGSGGALRGGSPPDEMVQRWRAVQQQKTPPPLPSPPPQPRQSTAAPQRLVHALARLVAVLTNLEDPRRKADCSQPFDCQQGGSAELPCCHACGDARVRMQVAAAAASAAAAAAWSARRATHLAERRRVHEVDFLELALA